MSASINVMDSPPLTLSFAEIQPGMEALVGGKAANLGRLTRAGMSVPPGFVLTTAAYRLGEADEVTDSLVAAYRTLGEGPVAVRSSGTAEDLEGASFAGQQDTLLNILGPAALWEALRACWTSLRSDRAVAYRAAQGIRESSVAMAVVVQRMVPAEAAGVLFTANPQGEPGTLLVEAVHGVGEALVSGSVTPDRWTLGPAGEVLDAEAPQSVLNPMQLVELARLAGEVRRLYGADQDVEWALADGRFWLLQARPITALAGEREAVRAEEIARLRARAEPEGTIWARYSVAEVLPEPLPFTWAMWRDFMRGGGGYGRMYRDLGYDPDPSLDEDGVLDLIAGRPYFNLSRDARLYFAGFPHEYPYAKLRADPALAIYPSLEANLSRAPRGFLLKLLGFTRKMAAAEAKLETAAQEVPSRLEREYFPAMVREAARLRETDLTGLSDAALLTEFEARRSYVFDYFAPEGLKASVLAGTAIEKLCAALKPAHGQRARRQAEALMAGVSAAPEYDLAGALRRLASGDLGADTFLEQFGHRGPGEMELANSRWRERGAPPITDCNPPAPMPSAPGGKAGWYCERARRFTSLREAAKHCLMLGYEALRAVLLELDRRHELAGGIFYLEPADLPRLAAGQSGLRGLIAARRKRRALALSLDAPRVVFSDDLEAVGRLVEPSDAGAMLQGTGVSPGTAAGPVLVLHAPEAAPPDARDFVLVCPSTDPGWVPLFLRARGVVLETGGVLSHGAIVARELGLPAVANVPDACRRLQHVGCVKLDGGEGRVWVLDEAAND